MSQVARFKWIPMLTVLAFALGLGACIREQAPDIVYFYEILCPACPESERALALAGDLSIAARKDGAEFLSHDVMRGDGMEILRSMSEEHSLDFFEVTLPAVFSGGRVYAGFDAVTEFLALKKDGK